MKFYQFTLILNFFLLVHCQTVTKNYSSYRRYPFCTPSQYMRYPTSTNDVVAIVNEAIDSGLKVKPIGARHSQTDIICTEGIPVDMNKMKFRQMNADNETATFGAGVTVMEAGEFLLQYGRALRTVPAYGGITIGGAIGTGAHGSTIKYNATISAQVVRMTVVNGLGQVVVISDPDDLNAFRVNLGLLGIVVEVTLYTVPLYKVLAHNYISSDDVLTNGVALNWARTNDQILFNWFPSTNQIVVSNLTFISADSEGTGYTYAVAPCTYGGFNVVAKRANEIASDLATNNCTLASTLGNKMFSAFEKMGEASLVGQVPGSVPVYTEDGTLVKNPAIGCPHVMFSTLCSEADVGFIGISPMYAHGDLNANITILDDELLLDINDLPVFVTAAKDIVKKTPTAFPLQGIFLRFSGKSDAYMSGAYQRDTIHIEFGLWRRADAYNEASGSLAGYQTILQLLTKKLTGRSHWGKSGLVYHSSEMLDLKFRLNPSARQSFVAAMKKFDPNEIFMNNFGRRIAGNDTKIDFDPLTTKCALLDNCFCSKNSDCGDTQECTTISGYSYPVCKTKNEAPCLVDPDMFPPVNDLLNWLNVTVPILADNVLAQCSLFGGVLG